jgi:hypothetical protein
LRIAGASSPPVMAGLDPAIHRPRQRTIAKNFSKKMDCRVKPGNDESLIHR